MCEDNPFYFQMGFEEINKEADFETRGFEVIHTLSHVNFIEVFDGL
jgi:hypothetical protein